MKKALITGPIGGMYGRDVEANLVAKALEDYYDLTFFSTGILLENPVCIDEIKNAKIFSLRYAYLKKPILYFFAFISWIINRCNNRLEDYSKNKINARLIKKYKWDLNILENEIRDKAIVVCFVQLSSSYLSDIIKLCKKHKIKIVIRTTGFIASCPIEYNLVQKVDLFIHHSTSNKNNLEKLCEHNYAIIDQTSTLENKLLKVKNINKNNDYIFGYIGRLSKEKGIQEMLEIAENLNLKLTIAGSGELEKNIFKKLKKNKNIKYLGYVKYHNLDTFFKNIDVFMINSTSETGPLTGLEAMCASRFIISRKVGAMPDRLSSNQNIWIKNDLQSSVESFLKLDPVQIQNMASKNRDIYLKNYSLNMIKNKYLKTINHLLNA